MSQQNIVVTLRPYESHDFSAYVSAHAQSTLDATRSEASLVEHHYSILAFEEMCDNYRALHEAQDAYILGIFDDNETLLGHCEIITLNDVKQRAQIIVTLYNPLNQHHHMLQCFQQVIITALGFDFNRLEVYCDIADKGTIDAWVQVGCRDEGNQLVQECDQACWRTRRVLSYTKP